MSILGRVKTFRRTGWGVILEVLLSMSLLSLFLAAAITYVPTSQTAKDFRQWAGIQHKAPAAVECVCPEPGETP